MYVVCKENGTGACRTLHRNLLLPISSLPVPFEEKPKQSRKTQVDKSKKSTDEHELQDNSNDDYTAEDGEQLQLTEEEELANEDVIIIEVAAREDETKLQSSIETQPQLVKEQESVEGDDQVVDHSTSREDETELQSSTETQPQAESVDPDDHAVEHKDEQEAEDKPVEDEQAEQGAEKPVPKPRRSARKRNHPQWMESGDYVMSQVDLTQSLASSWDLAERSKILRMLVTDEIFS